MTPRFWLTELPEDGKSFSKLTGRSASGDRRPELYPPPERWAEKLKSQMGYVSGIQLERMKAVHRSRGKDPGDDKKAWVELIYGR